MVIGGKISLFILFICFKAQYSKIMYILQNLQPYSKSIMKQLRPNQLTKNNINQPMRWVEVAFCKDIGQLKQYVYNDNQRIINRDSLKVVFIYQNKKKEGNF